MLSTAIGLILAGGIFLAPWFHGLTGVLDQWGALTLIFFCGFILESLFQSLSIRPGKDPFSTGWACILLWAAALTLFSSLPNISLPALLRFASLWVVYRLTLTACKRDRVHRLLLGSLVISGVFYSGYGWLQWAGYLPAYYWYDTAHMASRYVNGGHFAGFLILPFFSAMTVFLCSKHFLNRILSLSIILFLLATISMTGSRTVWGSLFISGIFLGVAFLRLNRINRRQMLLCIALLLLLAIFFIGCGLAHKVGHRFLQIWDGKTLNVFSLFHRIDFWRGCLHAIAARPWGWGTGTFVHIFPQFKVEADRFLVDYAHNEILQVGVDLGLAGISLALLFFFTMVRKNLAAIKNCVTGSPARISLSVFLSGSLCLFAASQFDFPLHIYATALIAAVFFGLMTAEIQRCAASLPPHDSTKELPKKRTSLMARAFLLSVALFFAAIFSATQLCAQIYFREAAQSERNFQWDKAMARYHQSIRWSPWNGDFYESRGRLLFKRAKLSFNREDKEAYFGEAILNFKEAARLDRFWPSSYFMVGKILTESGKRNEAQSFFKQASDLEPMNGFYLSRYAQACLENGQVELGMSLFERYQKLPFREGGFETLQILELVYGKVKKPDDLKRFIVSSSWQDHYTLGFFLGERGYLPAALVELDQAMILAREEMPEDYFMDHVGARIGNAYAKWGALQRALDVFETAKAHGVDRPVDQTMIEALKQRLRLAGVDNKAVS